MTKFDLATPAGSIGAQPRPISPRDAGTFAVIGLVAVIVGAAALAYVMAPAQAPATTTHQTTTDGYAPTLPSAPGGGRLADANALTDGWLTRYGAGAAPEAVLVDGWMTRFGASSTNDLVDGWSVRYLVNDE